MGAEPDARVGPEVTTNAAFLESRVHSGEVGHPKGDRAPAPARIPRAHNLEAGSVGEFDHELGLTQRVLADPRDPDLLHEVVTGRRRVVRGNVRRPREKARDRKSTRLNSSHRCISYA